jgi:hypothetical protein
MRVTSELNAGLTVNPHRPDKSLPYRGAWLNIGPEMIHLMELPNPDSLDERPVHGGRDRHFCIGIDTGGVEPLIERLEAAGMPIFSSLIIHATTTLYRVSHAPCLTCSSFAFILHGVIDQCKF